LTTEASGSLPLKGKVALVTGSSRGIGRAVALRLARAGAAVALNGTRDLSETEALIRAAGGRSASYIADVSKADQVEAMFARAAVDLGGVDILVSNAGVNDDGLILRMPDAAWDRVLDTNLKGAFLCSRAALKQMVRKRWGRAVFVGSIVGQQGNAGQANYAAAKAGLGGLAKSIAKEVASRGITANVVAPGFIETDMTAKLSDPVRAQIRERIPLGAFGTVDDVAGVVAFLCSEEGRYITGQVLLVDGGLGMA
jgi:3-oxoacyl-[acyl-carrier protein] reductase